MLDKQKLTQSSLRRFFSAYALRCLARHAITPGRQMAAKQQLDGSKPSHCGLQARQASACTSMSCYTYRQTPRLPAGPQCQAPAPCVAGPCHNVTTEQGCRVMQCPCVHKPLQRAQSCSAARPSQWGRFSQLISLGLCLEAGHLQGSPRSSRRNPCGPSREPGLPCKRAPACSSPPCHTPASAHLTSDSGSPAQRLPRSVPDLLPPPLACPRHCVKAKL